MIGTKPQQREFKDRLGRIERGGEHTTRHVYIGPVDEAATGRRAGRAKRARSLRAGGGSALGNLFMVPFAFLAGAAAVLAGRVAAFHLVPNPTAADALGAPVWSVTYGWLAVAALTILVLSMIFRLRGGGRFRALVVGFLGMFLFEGMMIERVPEAFVPLYSVEFVADVLDLRATGA